MANPTPIPSADTITGIILAGGRAQRMGGNDKGLISLDNKPMIKHVIQALKPQVHRIIINANRNQEIYEELGYPVVADSMQGYCGPLAGMASAMQIVDTSYIVTAPCDSPFIPSDLVQILSQTLIKDDAEISVAHNGERMQPVFALLRRTLLPSLLDYLETGERKIDRWYAKHRFTIADFSAKPDTFLNVNTPEEIEALEKKLADTSP